MNKLLIIGSGGREHALAWKLKQSPKVGEIFIAPGNAGTAQVGQNVDIKPTDFPALIEFAKKQKIDFTIVGPDDPLVAGIVDEFKKHNLKIWGPVKAAAEIEGSKAFAKELMKTNNIPTAEYKTFTNYDQALKYIDSYFNRGAPIHRPSSAKPINGHTTNRIVIKASGLALGKGVTICDSLDEAKKTLADVMVKKIFGHAGNQVVIEEFLDGMEFSTHAFSDGENFVMLPPSQDHKRIFDNDQGPNTGGMGTIAPLPWVTQAMMDNIASNIVKPALDGLRKLGAPFTGLLYPGLMFVHPVVRLFMGNTEADKSANYNSTPFKTIEFNARFGDPETQSYMRLLKSDLFDILEACVDGSLDKINIEWENKFAACIVLASGGYPGPYEKGKIITGVNEASKLEDIVIFHAGTALEKGTGPLSARILSPFLLTNGGRVLGVTAIGNDLKSALTKAYTAVNLIHFDGMHYRKDIGQKSLEVVL